MIEGNNELFASGYLYDFLRQNQQSQIGPAVDKIPKEQLLATPESDVVEHIFAQLSIEPLILHEDRMETTEEETKVEVSRDWRRDFNHHRGTFYVPGCKICIAIPFTGDSDLWMYTPNNAGLTCPYGNVRQPHGNRAGSVEMTFCCPIDTLDEQRLKNEIERQLNLLRSYVKSSTQDIHNYNIGLKESIEQHIKARQERISKTEGLASRLGLTLKRNPDAPPIEPLRLKRKLVRPLPPPPDSGFEPEPGIEEETYEHILGVIRHGLRTFETTPATFKSLGEEDLRNILLAHLNGHYEGDATGETFRNKGKTDIRIEDGNRAAFVAECKIWRGPKEFRSAIDQLLNYLTWRDCKASLVVFNKEVKGFSKVLSDISKELSEHKLFKKEFADQKREAEWRFVFRSAEDELREVIVHIFVANLFSSGD